MINKIKSIFAGEDGQGMTEYGFAMATIGIGTALTLVALRAPINELIIKVASAVAEAASVLSAAP